MPQILSSTIAILVILFILYTLFSHKYNNQKLIISFFTIILVVIFASANIYKEDLVFILKTFFGTGKGFFDGLSLFFLIPLTIISLCTFLYSIFYFPEDSHKKEWTNISIFFPLLTFAMIGVLISQNVILLLISWEIMALAAFFLLLTEHNQPEVLDAAKLYIILTHICTFFIFLAVAVCYKITGSFDFPEAGSIDAATADGFVLFLLVMIGFGIKAGVIPLHVWLPSAHASAPSNVSAIMSGLMIKMGVYGIIRFLSFFYNVPVYWGVLIFIAGIVSALTGVIYAIAQHDLKKLLAYHSIENIGIILMGIGLGLAGISMNNTAIVVLGFAGAMLHVFNHATFKSLLFMGAGVVIKYSGTKQMDNMGGLAKKLPVTFYTFLIASISISGLPPFNGFISEFFIYIGMFNILSNNEVNALNFFQLMGIPALALVGGLAAACFIKVNGTVFMGQSANDKSLKEQTFQETNLLKFVLVVPAAICVLIGVIPFIIKIPLENAIFAITEININLTDFFPFKEITFFILLFYLIFALAWLIFHNVYMKKVTYVNETWGCGYPATNQKFSYTATSFAATITELFRFILKMEIKKDTITEIFPKKSYFMTHIEDLFLNGIYKPSINFLDEHIDFIRKLQAGNINAYILYKLVAIILFIIYGIYLIW